MVHIRHEPIQEMCVIKWVKETNRTKHMTLQKLKKYSRIFNYPINSIKNGNFYQSPVLDLFKFKWPRFWLLIYWFDQWFNQISKREYIKNEKRKNIKFHQFLL